MRIRSRWMAPLALLCSACGGASPPAQGGSDIVTGAERFGWVQPAADAIRVVKQ